MESTGVYWIRFSILERNGLEVSLGQRQPCQERSGRKTDVKDCQCNNSTPSASLRKALQRTRLRNLQRRARELGFDVNPMLHVIGFLGDRKESEVVDGKPG